MATGGNSNATQEKEDEIKKDQELKKKLKAAEKMFIKTEIPMNLALKRIAKI